MKVAAYARAATKVKSESQSRVDNQLAQIRKWVKANQHSIFHEYVDEGASGLSLARPQLQHMLEDLERDPAPFDAVVIQSLSCLARNEATMITVERRLKSRGVSLIVLTRTSAGDIQKQNAVLEAVFAQLEAARTASSQSSKTRRVSMLKVVTPDGRPES